jgi:hypothetical protein
VPGMRLRARKHQDAKADADELLTLRISEIKTKGTAGRRQNVGQQALIGNWLA